MTSVDAGGPPSRTLGHCTGCRERYELVDSVVPPHMWPHSTPLMITCSGGNQPPAEEAT